jgi:ABC-2 type transport system ATP-binding protein
MNLKKSMRAVLAVSMLAGVVGTVPGHADAEITHITLTSKAPDGITLHATVFKPEGASSSSPVPMIMHSHGWGGSRSRSGMTSWTDNGFGVLSFDQRGFGASGGQANVEDPELEGKDVETIVDYIASLDWVAKDNGGAVDEAFGTQDPVLGAIGGSYGGGYQTIGALTETHNYGHTRFNALAPEITWYDLPESLGPQGVVRTLWVTLLYATGLSTVPQYIHEGYVVGAATGWFPDGTVPGTHNLKAEFLEHSPKGFADNGTFLDIPVLIGQGSTDNLFNLNQGIHNLLDVVTPTAQEQSLLVGYNGGHVLPEALPYSNPVGGDKCSPGGFSSLSRAFFTEVFTGGDTQTLLPARFNITDHKGATCLSTSSVTTYEDKAPAVPAIASVSLPVGVPLQLKIAEGPLKITGIPTLSGTITNSPDARAVFGLSVGTNEADAVLQQNNVMPLRRLLPSALEEFEIELPGVGIDLAEGENLYLTVSQTASHFVGFSGRTPGAWAIADPIVSLPILQD